MSDLDKEEADEDVNMLYGSSEGVRVFIAPPELLSEQTLGDKMFAWYNNVEVDDEARSDAVSDAITVSTATSTVRGPIEERNGGADYLYGRLTQSLFHVFG